MHYQYSSMVNWRKFSIFSLLVALLIIFIGSYYLLQSPDIVSTTSAIITVLYLAVILFWLLRGFYYWRIPNKNYIVFDKDQLTVDRISFFRTRAIPLEQVQRIVDKEEVFIVVVSEGKEEVIHKNWLLEEDISKLQRDLHALLGESYITSY
ncbi:hypothetical protein MUN88_14340 [Gracilibacillus caseinilyticus]|uniref:PH domain-containing protein n=1 Tax=Gracilibacillus caseinilyticus TaxID=2932256 RepID=A0ABY4ES37_9BACI|nr:hypothetical protein [Gracilibacillus caseinilyticus]UOQ47245.1 hypothetical protein MUN88_14340 [Gracilibacillus caseinilyticus]